MARIRFDVVLVGVIVGIFAGYIMAKTDAYEFFDTLVDIRGELVRNYVEEPDQQELLDGAIQGMLQRLNDPHTGYFSPEDLRQFDQQTRATFSGIGAEIREDEKGQLVISSPLEDSPAFEAGILAGDVILAVDGEPTNDLNIREAVSLITGEEGTDVTLTVRRLTGEEEQITITRRQIQIQTIKGFGRVGDPPRWDFMLDDEARVGYIRITQFSDPTADDLRAAIEGLKQRGMEGLIIDLRFDPGGLLDQAVTISDMFLSEGVIVSTRGRNIPEREWTASGRDTVGDFPMVVLVNEFSASASEIVAGALKDNGRAAIVGTRTFGKGSVQQVVRLESGRGALKLTTAYYYLPSGRNLERRDDSEVWGVDPTDGYYVPMSHEQVRQMTTARHEADVLRNNNHNSHNSETDDGPVRADRVTPDWLREQRSDPQLAAALQTMLAKLETGEFEPVGRDNATLMAHVSERAMLQSRRERFQESVDEIDKMLRELDRKIAELDGDIDPEDLDLGFDLDELPDAEPIEEPIAP